MTINMKTILFAAASLVVFAGTEGKAVTAAQEHNLGVAVIEEANERQDARAAVKDTILGNMANTDARHDAERALMSATVETISAAEGRRGIARITGNESKNEINEAQNDAAIAVLEKETAGRKEADILRDAALKDAAEMGVVGGL